MCIKIYQDVSSIFKYVQVTCSILFHVYPLCCQDGELVHVGSWSTQITQQLSGEMVSISALFGEAFLHPIALLIC